MLLRLAIMVALLSTAPPAWPAEQGPRSVKICAIRALNEVLSFDFDFKLSRREIHDVTPEASKGFFKVYYDGRFFGESVGYEAVYRFKCKYDRAENRIESLEFYLED